MQTFKVSAKINQEVKVEIEGVGTVRQIHIAEKLYQWGVITWKARMTSQRIRLTDELLNIAINELKLYPRQF